MATLAFWQEKTLAQMTPVEWEKLCDGCGKCCLHKLEDEDSGEVYYTRVACRYLKSTGGCRVYHKRSAHVPTCLSLAPASLSQFDWLPSSCAYRLVAQGEPLPSWHPLVSGDIQSVNRAGHLAGAWARCETEIAQEDYEEHIIQWV